MAKTPSNAKVKELLSFIPLWLHGVLLGYSLKIPGM
jgi:hypothetical protein